jgi:hypothetical protein
MMLCSVAAVAQMLARPGTLVIKSEPSGASIIINGVPASQATDANFVVSAATYKVSVGSPGTKPYCAETSISVAAGQTVVRICGESGWK